MTLFPSKNWRYTSFPNTCFSCVVCECAHRAWCLHTVIRFSCLFFCSVVFLFDPIHLRRRNFVFFVIVTPNDQKIAFMAVLQVRHGVGTFNALKVVLSSAIIIICAELLSGVYGFFRWNFHFFFGIYKKIKKKHKQSAWNASFISVCTSYILPEEKIEGKHKYIFDERTFSD